MLEESSGSKGLCSYRALMSRQKLKQPPKHSSDIGKRCYKIPLPHTWQATIRQLCTTPMDNADRGAICDCDSGQRIAIRKGKKKTLPSNRLVCALSVKALGRGEDGTNTVLPPVQDLHLFFWTFPVRTLWCHCRLRALCKQP
ncbi:hypothetical protein GJAV_G00145160 [Gymnothorax javanicus]|nr:hypothetical protein GJAV_G00145160 [Gymnothorax javanicus]